MPKRKSSTPSAYATAKAMLAAQSQMKKMKYAKYAKSKWPTKDYGLAYIPRGSEWSLQNFGTSRAEASDDQKKNRRDYGFSGRGLYEGRGKVNWKDIEGVGHRFLTKGIPNLIKAGSSMKSFMGRGMYHSEIANEVMSGGVSKSANISSAGDETGSICISNREYVGDIFAPATSGIFSVTPFPLNPGLEQTFPWLSQLACNYEEFEFIQLVFEFVSSIQDVNSSNGQVGTIITATNYNASQPNFTDKPQMAAYYGSVSGRTTDDQTHGVECDPNKLSGSAGSYIRTNPVLTGEDLKAYDHGIFQLATHNIPTAMLNGTLGELYVNYKVMLRKPKFLSGRGLAITRALFVSGGSETYLRPFGTNALMLKGQQNNLNIAINVDADNNTVLTFPSYYCGLLEVKVLIEGTSLAGSVYSSGTPLGNVSFVNDIYAASITSADTPSFVSNAVGGTGAIAIFHLSIQPATNATDNKFTLITGMTSASTITQSSIDITEYNSGFNSTNGRPTLVNSANTVVVP